MAGGKSAEVDLIEHFWGRVTGRPDVDLEHVSKSAAEQTLLRRLATPCPSAEPGAAIESSSVVELAKHHDRECAAMLTELGDALSVVLATDFPLVSEHLQRQVRAQGGPLHAATLLFAARACGGASGKELAAAAVALELLASFPSLLLQVTERGSSIERRLNNMLAVLMADFAVSRSLRPLSELSPHLVAMAAELTCSMSEGAALELEDLGNRERTAERYFAAVDRLDGASFALAAKLGGELATATREAVAALESYGHQLGTAFAISRDIRALLVGDEVTGEKPGTALVEGRCSLPVIYALEADRRLCRLFERSIGRGDAATVVYAVRTAGGIEKAAAQCRRHVDRARAALGSAASLSGTGLVALSELAVNLSGVPERRQGMAPAA